MNEAHDHSDTHLTDLPDPPTLTVTFVSRDQLLDVLCKKVFGAEPVYSEGGYTVETRTVRSKPQTVDRNPRTCQCATCGHEWETGQSGAHSCMGNLVNQKRALCTDLDTALEALDDERALRKAAEGKVAKLRESLGTLLSAFRINVRLENDKGTDTFLKPWEEILTKNQ